MWEVSAGESGVQGQPLLDSESEARGQPEHMRSCFKKPNKS